MPHPWMKLSALRYGLLLFWISSGRTTAQSVVDIVVDHPTVGQTARVSWSVQGGPFAPTVLGVSSGVGPNFVGGIGLVNLDLAASEFTAIDLGPSDAFGRGSLLVAIPPTLSLVNIQPFYGAIAAVPSSGIAVSRTARMQFDFPDSYRSTVSPMTVARANHTATALSSRRPGDYRVFIAGGGNGTFFAPVGTASTELFDPLSRTFTPGPTMSNPRSLHAAVQLADGRVLITGGTHGGVTYASCDIFDPATGGLVPVTPMTTPRAAHAATVLDTGQVLVSGGTSGYVGPGAGFWAAVPLALGSAEIYDPASDGWTAVSGTIAPPRFGHTQSLLVDGRVLIAGGVYGYTSQYATAISQTSFYDPMIGAFAPGPQLPSDGGLTADGGRFGHAAVVLPSGVVQLIGGINGGFVSPSLPTVNMSMFVMSLIPLGGSWVWIPSLPLPTATAFHGAAALADGSVIILGAANSACSWYDCMLLPGPVLLPQVLSPLGTNPVLGVTTPTPLGFHTLTDLGDGTYLVCGGRTAPFGCSGSATAQAMIYTAVQ